ncbi:benzoate transporter [Streptomyces sp. CS131]|uniref:WD40 repeat domain-containing protein n=1 Tax=Streptomyces sp. CS131 TaxID=2162711 RepID=UPI000D50D9C3|nr:benzoate transporter [Streptomyces sp. CS131]PVC81241.1 benzoate transporter [Streptomyces sp. CS131]
MTGPAGDDRHTEIHRQLAAALAELVPDDPSIPPHPYLRRHLARHAAQGRVLDDVHVPPALLPWESSSGLGRLLAGESSPPAHQQWLQVWATLEPYSRELSPLSRLTSLHLAHHAATSRLRPGPRAGSPDAPFDRSPVTPLWSDCANPDNVWALNDADVVSLASVVPRRRSPAQALLVTGDDHGVVRVLRRDGSAAAPPVTLHEGAVTHLLPLHEGIVATGSTDGAVAILNAPRGRRTGEVLRRTAAWVTALTLHRPPGRTAVLLAAWSDGHLAAFNTATLHRVDIPLPALVPGAAHLFGTTGPDGAGLLLVAQHDTVSASDGRTTRVCSRHSAPVRTLVALSEPGAYAVGDAHGRLSVHSVDADADIRTHSVEAVASGAVTALAVVTVEGRETLAAGGADGTVRLWRSDSLEPVGESLPAHAEAVTALTALSDGPVTRLITAGSDRTVRNWPLDGSTFRHGRARWNRVTASALSPGPVHLLAVTEGTTTLVRDIGTGTERPLIEDETVTALAWARLHHRPVLAAALSDNSIALRALEPGDDPEPPPRLRGHFSPALALLALPGAGGSSLLASGSADGTVRLWDLDRLRSLAVFDDHRFSVRALASTRTDDGVLLASGGSDGKVRVWDVGALAQHGPTIRCGQNIVNDVAFARLRGETGLRMVTAGQNGTLRLWDPDAASGPLAEFAPGDGELQAVTAFRVHRRRLVLAAAGATGIHLWDAAADRMLLQIVTGHPVTALRVAPQPEGELSTVLLATGEAGTMIFRIHHDRL